MNAAARRILIAAAREVYVPGALTPTTITVDRRCSSCGIARAMCDSLTCIRKPGAEDPEAVLSTRRAEA